MAKALCNNVWYHELSPSTYFSEEDLERMILLNFRSIFPRHKLFVYKRDLWDPVNNRNKRADFAMVHENYDEWYIIEVELSGHSLGHVKDQIESFYNCEFGEEHVDSIAEKDSSFDREKISNMIINRPPKLLVIVNEPKPIWEKELEVFQCDICVFQVYRNHNRRNLFRINGKYPQIGDLYSFCKYIKQVPYSVVLDSHSFLDRFGIHDGGEIEIDYDGKLSKWRRIDDRRKTYLVSDSDYPILDELTTRYSLVFHPHTNLFQFQVS